jgi:hypothetical protein
VHVRAGVITVALAAVAIRGDRIRGGRDGDDDACAVNSGQMVMVGCMIRIVVMRVCVEDHGRSAPVTAEGQDG